MRMAVRALTLGLVLVVLGIGRATGQVEEFSYANPQRFVVKDITVEGVQYGEPDVIITLSGLSKGDTIELPGKQVTEAVKKLTKQNLSTSSLPSSLASPA